MSTIRNRWLSEWTSGEVGTHDFSHTPIAIPTSAIEQHGKDTMPIGTDYLIAKGLIDHTIAAMKASDPGLFLPLQPFGYSPEHTHFPGTVTLGYQTYLSILMDIGTSLARWGVRKVLLLNFHGGNPPLNQIAAMEFKNRFGIITAEYNYARDISVASQLFGQEEAAYGYHAGAMEYALGLFLFPEIMKRTSPGNFPSSFAAVDKSFRTLSMGSGVSSVAWHTESAHASGAIGNSLNVSKDQGKTLADHAAKEIIGALHDLNSQELAKAFAQKPSHSL